MAEADADSSDFDVPDLTAVASYTLEEAVICLDVSRDGSLLAAGSLVDEITVLDQQLQLVARLDGHEGGTNSLAFSSCKLVSAGEDGKAKIWDAKVLGACIAQLECEGVDADR
jgi:WD40 repeat protein